MPDADTDNYHHAYHTRSLRWLLPTSAVVCTLFVAWWLYAVLGHSQPRRTQGPVDGGLDEIGQMAGIEFPESAQLDNSYVSCLGKECELLALLRFPHGELDRFVKTLPPGIEIGRDPTDPPYVGIHEGFGDATTWWQPDLTGDCMVVFVPLHETEDRRWASCKLVLDLGDEAAVTAYLQAFVQ